jgi:hypothetical protein
MEAFYSWAFGSKPPYKTLAETVFSIHLIWTILSPLQMVFLFFFGAAYIPFFITYILINITAPMIFRGCPLTKLEKHFRGKANEPFDPKLTFVQYISSRWFGTLLPRWKVHIMHGTGYAIAILIIWFKILN